MPEYTVQEHGDFCIENSAVGRNLSLGIIRSQYGDSEHEGNFIVEKRREKLPLNWESCEENGKVSKIKFITVKFVKGHSCSLYFLDLHVSHQSQVYLILGVDR